MGEGRVGDGGGAGGTAGMSACAFLCIDCRGAHGHVLFGGLAGFFCSFVLRPGYQRVRVIKTYCSVWVARV